MTRTNTEIKFIRGKSGYGPMPYGKYAGQPTVSLKLSSSSQNSMKVNSLENIWVSRNWKRKISSGYARLRLFGNDPFSEEHKESIEFLIDKMDPRFLDIEVQDKFINKEPSRFTQRRTDTYTFLIDMTKDEIRYDFETLDYISENIANDGNAQYLFKVDSVMCEDPIKNFRREYNIYDSDIWLFPKGRKRRTMEETLPNIINVAKRNRWNVSPRMDLMTDTDEEESD